MAASEGSETKKENPESHKMKIQNFPGKEKHQKAYRFKSIGEGNPQDNKNVPKFPKLLPGL